MTLEKALQQHIDRRLAGLTASPVRRARIREAVKCETRPPRKASAALVFALSLVLLTAALAIGESLNLFHLFGANDRRYQQLAASSMPAAAAPLEISDKHLGTVTAAIDSVYFDGLTLNLAFSIENHLIFEKYTPSEEEIAQMTKTYALKLPVSENQPGAEIIAAYNEAIRYGRPFSMRSWEITSDESTYLHAGGSLTAYRTDAFYSPAGKYCELREFRAPLPGNAARSDTLNIRIPLAKEEKIYHFDGKHLYFSWKSTPIGELTASAGKAPDSLRRMAGEGEINGARVTADMQLSPMGALLTLKSDTPFNQFLPEPTQPDGSDHWLVATAYDENGRRMEMLHYLQPDDSTEITLQLAGTGALPESLTVYLYIASQPTYPPEETAVGIPLHIQ